MVSCWIRWIRLLGTGRGKLLDSLDSLLGTGRGKSLDSLDPLIGTVTGVLGTVRQNWHTGLARDDK